MTQEVDPRLVALGLVPAPAAKSSEDSFTAGSAATGVAAPTVPSAPTAPAAPDPHAGLFAGMGKFTGMPADAAAGAPPADNPWAVPGAVDPAADPWATPSAGSWSTPPADNALAAPPAGNAWDAQPAGNPWASVGPPPASAPAPQAPSPAPAFGFGPPAPAAESASPALSSPAFPSQPHVPPQFTVPPAAPAFTPPVPAAPAFTASPVASPAPEAPMREAPPPLPPLVSAMPAATPVAEAPTAPGKAEKKQKAKKEKVAAKVAKVPKAPKVEKVKAPPKPRFVLPPSGVLLRGPIVMGYPEKKFQITLEQLGFRINTPEQLDVAWSSVKDIRARRGRVIIRVKGQRPLAFGIPVEGVSEPTLAGPLAKVVQEASHGSLDLAGSSFLELQNATDSLKDHFHDEDDPLVPTVVGLVFMLGGLTFTALLPDALAIATRTPTGGGAYLLDFPLAGLDPRILLAAFGAGAMIAAGIVRVAMGKAATAWARGTLRGWHEGSRKAVDLGRRALAAIILNPAIAAAVVLVAIVMTLPSSRVQTVIDAGGFHIMREVPFFDEFRPWSSVRDMTTVPAPTNLHFEGVAVVFQFEDKPLISTRDAHLRGGTDKQLLASATKWREAASER